DPLAPWPRAMSYGVVFVHCTVISVCASTLLVRTPTDPNDSVGVFRTVQVAVIVSVTFRVPVAVAAYATVPRAATAAAAPRPMASLPMILVAPVDPRGPAAAVRGEAKSVTLRSDQAWPPDEPRVDARGQGNFLI